MVVAVMLVMVVSVRVAISPASALPGSAKVA
jgi:hypothetical protein